MPRLSFGEWMLTPTHDGHLHQDEVRTLFYKIEELLANFKGQINRRRLFLIVAHCVYEKSE